MPSANYYRAIVPTLPTELVIQLDQLCQSPSTEALVDALIRFLSGAECPEALPESIRAQWPEKQKATRDILYAYSPSSFDRKRQPDGDGNLFSDIKRRRLTPPGSNGSQDGQASFDVGRPIFTLHSISVTSPIRKKADITVHERGLRFTNPGTHSIETTMPLSSLKRAFLLPTRGKNKPHWTIVLISTDSPDRGKPIISSAQAYPQVIFGMDATTALPISITKYGPDSLPAVETIAKGGTTLPSLKTFLSHLGIQTLEPTADVFKSACSGYGANAGQGGIPGVEACRAAKVGSLWFMKEGILWGESKPCEFWAVDDFLGQSEGVRVLAHPGGRTCSVILARKTSEELPDDEEDVGQETEFTMIDSRELEGINHWVREHWHLFGKGNTVDKGKAKAVPSLYKGPMTIYHIGDESDEDDEDFSVDSSDDGDGGSSAASDCGEEGSGEASSDEAGSEDAENEEGVEDAEQVEDDEEELKEERHPLLQRGAVPRMSKAAVDMAIGMTTQDFLGRAEIVESEEEEDQEDELDE